MTLPLTICAICSATFEARTSYGLCSSCISRDRLREFDRWHSAVKHAERQNIPTGLTLLQWLATISDHRGLCSFCQQMPHSTIEMLSPIAGLTWQNVVPACRSCTQIKRIGWENACARVMLYLTANEGRSEDDISLEYHYEGEDGPDLIAPVGERPHD